MQNDTSTEKENIQNGCEREAWTEEKLSFVLEEPLFMIPSKDLSASISIKIWQARWQERRYSFMYRDPDGTFREDQYMKEFEADTKALLRRLNEYLKTPS